MLWKCNMMMYLFVLSCIVSAKFILGEECDKSGILIYEDLGCTPVYEDDKKCPSKYTCELIESSDKNCYFRGRSFVHGERVDSSLTSPSCDAGCVCVAVNGKAKFTCAILDCPEWLGVPVRYMCYRKYSLDNCCSVGQACPPFDNIEKCVFEGKEYWEGLKFSPSNTCLDCVCQKGFNGTLEKPFCKRRSCGQQLRSTPGSAITASCAPFYTKDSQVLCCPDSWVCPEGSEVIKGEAKSENACKFGDKTVKVGQYVELLNFKDSLGRTFDTVRCECVVPPFLKCTDV